MENAIKMAPQFPGCNMARYKVFSFLPGYTLFHKIALTNKHTREQLCSAGGLLDQIIVITVRHELTEKT
jgi:hypothetical protein